MSARHNLQRPQSRTSITKKRPLPKDHKDLDRNSKKQRTRSPNARPIEKGNNSFGRSGTLRCTPCRSRRQKCVFDALELPCAHCAKRGLPCETVHKVWGPKRQLSQYEKTSINEHPCVDLIRYMVPPHLRISESVITLRKLQLVYGIGGGGSYCQKLSPTSFRLQAVYQKRRVLHLPVTLSKYPAQFPELNILSDLKMNTSCDFAPRQPIVSLEKLESLFLRPPPRQLGINRLVPIDPIEFLAPESLFRYNLRLFHVSNGRVEAVTDSWVSEILKQSESLVVLAALIQRFKFDRLAETPVKKREMITTTPDKGEMYFQISPVK